MLQILSETFKQPLNNIGTLILGQCYLHENNGDPQLLILIKKVCTVALVIFFSLVAITAIPIWVVGDVIEAIDIGNQPFERRTFPIPDHPTSLDPKMTEFLGSSLSTYQNTNDPEFCKGSDWQNYVEKNFTGDKAHLAPGMGVDILTEEGLNLLIASTLEMNGNTLRFSVEWADIRNKDGSFNEVAMEQYVKVARKLKKSGITPFVTLHHFVTPLDKQGRMLFESPKGVDEYLKFATYVYDHLSDHVEHFFTFNEPHVNGVENYIRGVFPAAGIANFYTYTQVTNRKLEAHKLVHRELHSMAEKKGKTVHVGLTHQAVMFETTSRWNYLARAVAFVFTYLFHDNFMNWAVNNTSSLDLLGIQYYSKPLLSGIIPDSTCREGEEMVEPMHFRFYPKGIYDILQDVHNQLGNRVSLLITETGTAGKNDVKGSDNDTMDKRRKDYFTESIEATRAIQDLGINVIGYLFWSLFRNFEWAFGCSEKHDFGMIAINPETRETRPTAGFTAIQEIFANTQRAAGRQLATARS